MARWTPGTSGKECFMVESMIKFSRMRYVSAGVVIRCSRNVAVDDLIENGALSPVKIIDPSVKVVDIEIEVGSKQKSRAAHPEVIGGEDVSVSTFRPIATPVAHKEGPNLEGKVE